MISKPRVLVIGLDGATLDLILPWAKAGYLPNIAKFITNGCVGTLRSTIHPISPTAWSTFMTGVNPGKHGVFDFTIRDFRHYGMQVSLRPNLPNIWKILSEYNRKVCVVNVPQTYPPEPVNGFLITGLGTPSGRIFTYPEDLTDKLNRKNYTLVTPNTIQRDGYEAFVKGVYTVAEDVVQTAIELMEQIDWDFSMVVLRLTDEIPHYFWHYFDSSHPLHPKGLNKYQDTILQTYQAADTFVGQLLAMADESETTTIIMSDHGFGPLYQDVYLNEWLRQEGYLYLASNQSTNNIKRITLLRKLGLTRAQIGPALGRLGLNNLRAFLRDKTGTLISMFPEDKRSHIDELVDWSKTKAYSVGYLGQIYLNVVGRDPEGIISPGIEYEQERQKLIESLYAWRDSRDGKKVVDYVYCKEEIYAGPYLNSAPDLLVVMRDFSYITRQNYEFTSQQQIFAMPPTHETGGHRQNGIIMIKGSTIASNVTINANIEDVAPTILHILGCAIPSVLDGSVIEEVLLPSISTRPINYTDHFDFSPNVNTSSLSIAEEKELLERLKGLGYIN